MSVDPDLNRFLDAQDGTDGTHWGAAYDRARAELAAGKKVSHWMWYVFPQIRGLGNSPAAVWFAVQHPCEALAYLRHPVLGTRYADCVGLVMARVSRPGPQGGWPALQGMLGGIDAKKFLSSLTLFGEVARASGDPAFAGLSEALESCDALGLRTCKFTEGKLAALGDWLSSCRE